MYIINVQDEMEGDGMIRVALMVTDILCERHEWLYTVISKGQKEENV